MTSEDATVAAAVYDLLQLLPAVPAEAEATLTIVEHALMHPGKQPDGWTGAASYAFAYLRKRSPEMAAAIIAAARPILQDVRPGFTGVGGPA